MLNLVVFETEEELCELTGLTEEELWQKGFNLDDWEIGFQSEVKLHKTPTKKDIENGYRKNELIALFDLPAHWMTTTMHHLSPMLRREVPITERSSGCQDLVRFFALLRIKPHAPPLVRVPVNSFEFHSCERTPQVEYLMRLRRHRSPLGPNT